LALPDDVTLMGVAVEAPNRCAQARSVQLVQPDLVTRLKLLNIGVVIHRAPETRNPHLAGLGDG